MGPLYEARLGRRMFEILIPLTFLITFGGLSNAFAGDLTSNKTGLCGPVLLCKDAAIQDAASKFFNGERAVCFGDMPNWRHDIGNRTLTREEFMSGYIFRNRPITWEQKDYGILVGRGVGMNVYLVRGQCDDEDEETNMRIIGIFDIDGEVVRGCCGDRFPRSE